MTKWKPYEGKKSDELICFILVKSKYDFGVQYEESFSIQLPRKMSRGEVVKEYIKNSDFRERCHSLSEKDKKKVERILCKWSDKY